MGMQGNEEIVEYNAALHTMEFDCKGATPESNAERIAANAEKISELEKLAQENRESHDKVLESIASGRDRVTQNAEKILERRKLIEESHEKVIEQRAMVATLIEFS